MKHRKILLSFLFLSGIMPFGFGQDPHFSQYFASPLTLNPALTGNIDGSLRIASNYRQQWWSTGSPFTTASLSFEQRLLENRLGDNDRFGVGGLMMVDNTMSGGLRSTYMSVSGSFHKGLSEQHRLGVGFQGTYGNRIVDISRLNFENQFVADGFDTNLPSGEAVLSTIKPTVGLHTGLMYTYEDALSRIYFGWSMYHVNRPRQTILDDSLSRIPQRHTLHAGFVLLSGESLRITGHALWQSQAKASEVSIGGAVGYDVGSDNTFFVGAWHRFNESIYPYLSYVRNGMQVALTYDWQIGGIKTALPKNGSIELSFIYSKPDNRFEKRAMPWNY